MEKVFAPFTPKQVEDLKMYHNNEMMHPFTCCGPSDIPECQRNSGKNEGVLIPTEKGWLCPCGKYTQNWAHDFMFFLPGGYIVEDVKRIEE
jgi:hypothetical protein